MKPLTSKEQYALSVVESSGRASVTASFVAARAAEQLGDSGSVRSWSAVLSSLGRKGKVEALANGLLNKTFYLPKRETT